MKLGIGKLLMAGALATLLAACGGSSGGVSNKSKTIKGVALKADGSAFSSGATVVAVDQNGNTAQGAVDTNGNYSVTLVGVASSGKKSKLVEGNSFIRIKEGTNVIDLAISEDQTKVNANAITAAASQLVIGDSGLNLNDVFSEASEKTNKEITSASVLAALAKVKVVTEELFKKNASTVAGALFGYGEKGADLIDIDKILNGSAKEKEVTLLKAASAVTSDLVAAAVQAANNPSSENFLFNNINFFQAIGKELAKEEKPSNTAFSDYLNSVLKDSGAKNALKDVKEALNELVTALKADPEATLAIEIPEVAQSAPTVIVSVSRSGDTINYGVEGGAIGDIAVASLAVLSGSDVKAVVTAELLFDGTKLSPSTAKITVITKNVEVTVKNSAAVSEGSINLATALSEAKIALVNAKQSELAESIPATTTGYTIVVASNPIKRANVKSVSTYIAGNGVTVSASSGVTFK